MSNLPIQQTLPLITTESTEILRRQLPDFGISNTVSVTSVLSHWLNRGEQRFDGSYYANLATRAYRIIEDCGYPSKAIGEVTKSFFYPGRFKRVYAKNKNAGTPFLTASMAMHFRPRSEVYLSNFSDSLKECLINEGMILMTRSGTVGRCVIVGKRLSTFALSDDAFRIEVNDDVLSGYLFAFFSSWIGQALITKDQYGSAIKHLEPHHVTNIQIPCIPREQQEMIHNLIMKAFYLREKANSLLDDADALLYKELGLPEFDESLVPYLTLTTNKAASSPEIPHPRAFTVNSSDLENRFDGSYHLPIGRVIAEILNGGKFSPQPLGKIANSIIIPPRFKRLYVSREYGIPFIRPSQLPQIRPFDIGYISRKTVELPSLLIHQNHILVTTDGTVGRISLVTSHINGWAGSNNIARITTNSEPYRNGYLAAFLNTPYGFFQLTRPIYGGVIDHIEVPHIKGVLIPLAPPKLQEEIGEKVLLAYHNKDEATAIEEKALRMLEVILEKKQKAIE